MEMEAQANALAPRKIEGRLLGGAGRLWNAKGSCGEFTTRFAKTCFATGHGEEVVNLFGEHALPLHARPEVWIIQFATAHVADAPEHLLLAFRKMAVEPFDKKIFYREREPHRQATRAACTGFNGRGHNGRDFVIG